MLSVLAVMSVPAVAGAANDDLQLVITSAYVDHSTHRLVITGQNLTKGASARPLQNAHPLVTLDLQPMVVERSSPYEIVVAPLSPTYPEGSHLLTVSRGNGARDSATFVVAVYSEPSVIVGPTGPAGPQGPAGPAGPAGATDQQVRQVPRVRQDRRDPQAPQVPRARKDWSGHLVRRDPRDRRVPWDRRYCRTAGGSGPPVASDRSGRRDRRARRAGWVSGLEVV